MDAWGLHGRMPRFGGPVRQFRRLVGGPCDPSCRPDECWLSFSPWLWEPFKVFRRSQPTGPARRRPGAPLRGRLLRARCSPPAARQGLGRPLQRGDRTTTGTWSLLRRTDHALPEDDVRRHHLRADGDAAHGRVGHEVRRRIVHHRSGGFGQGTGPRRRGGSPVPHVRPPQAGRGEHAGTIEGVPARDGQHDLPQGLSDQLPRAGRHAVDSGVDGAGRCPRRHRRGLPVVELSRVDVQRPPDGVEFRRARREQLRTPRQPLGRLPELVGKLLRHPHARHVRRDAGGTLGAACRPSRARARRRSTR